SENLSNELCKILNFSFGLRSHATPVFISLHWLPIKSRSHFKILFLTYRALHGQSPAYISEILRPYAMSRSLRSSYQGLLSVPHSRLKSKADCAFEVIAPKLWNSLPLDLRAVDTVDIFKKKLKTHVFKFAFA
ncbi:hypothetical protein LDENG_00065990, partial [Lucifuga dentata]